MQSSIPEVARNLAPTGTLRVALNFGNSGLVHDDAETGQPAGMSVDLTLGLARELELDVEFLRFESAHQVLGVVDDDCWDVAFLAVTPRRLECLQFTRPYLTVPAGCLVRADSALHHCGQVDRAGLRIAVGTGSVCDHFLSQHLEHASVVRAPTSPLAVNLFVDQDLDAVAGIQPCLAAWLDQDAGYRLLDGRFTMIEHAIATPRRRTLGWAYLASYTERMKACRFIAQSLARKPQCGALIPA